jgi:hypothetical protein
MNIEIERANKLQSELEVFKLQQNIIKSDLIKLQEGMEKKKKKGGKRPSRLGGSRASKSRSSFSR